MSKLPNLRRVDKKMSEAAINELLRSGYSGHLATVDLYGMPYSCPLLYVWHDHRIWLHNARSSGHLLSNLQSNPNACFSIAEAGEVFSYGRYECDTTIAYQSAVIFGKIDVIESPPEKTTFFELLMNKYSSPDASRPKNFFPRLDDTTVYAMTLERITGKDTALPALSEQWPAIDNTKSPHAQTPK